MILWNHYAVGGSKARGFCGVFSGYGSCVLQSFFHLSSAKSFFFYAVSSSCYFLLYEVAVWFAVWLISSVWCNYGLIHIAMWHKCIGFSQYVAFPPNKNKDRYYWGLSISDVLKVVIVETRNFELKIYI
jgi:hypothetical protein